MIGDNKSVCALAYLIAKDIKGYIKTHEHEYEEWLKVQIEDGERIAKCG